jgi:hypothetical protein
MGTMNLRMTNAAARTRRTASRSSPSWGLLHMNRLVMMRQMTTIQVATGYSLPIHHPTALKTTHMGISGNIRHLSSMEAMWRGSSPHKSNISQAPLKSRARISITDPVSIVNLKRFISISSVYIDTITPLAGSVNRSPNMAGHDQYVDRDSRYDRRYTSYREHHEHVSLTSIQRKL